MHDSRDWYFTLGSATPEEIQRALDDALAGARNSGVLAHHHASQDDPSGNGNRIDLTIADQDALDVRRLITATVTGQGLEGQAIEVLIQIGTGISVAAAVGIWNAALKALKEEFGDDAVGAQTTGRHVRGGGPSRN